MSVLLIEKNVTDGKTTMRRTFRTLLHWGSYPMPFGVLVGLATAALLWWLLGPSPRWRVAGDWKPVAFNADGSKLLCIQMQGHSYGGLAVLVTATGQILEQYPDPRGYALWFFGPDGQVMAVKKNTVVGSHCELELIEVASGKVRGRFRPKGYVPQQPQIVLDDTDFAKVALAASPDGRRIVIGNFHNDIGRVTGPQELRLWDVAMGTVGPPIQGRAIPDTGIAFSPDGSMFAVLDYVLGSKVTQVRRFVAIDGAVVEPPITLSKVPYDLNCGRDGRWRVLGDRMTFTSGTLEVFDLVVGAEPTSGISVDHQLNLDPRFSLDGECVVVITIDHSLPPGWWQRLLRWFGRGPSNRIQTDHLHVFETRSGRELLHLQQSTDDMFQLVTPFRALIAPDGQHLAVGRGRSKNVLEWWELEGAMARSWGWALLGGVVAAVLAWYWRQKMFRGMTKAVG